MSALETLKKMQEKIESLKADLEIKKLEHEALEESVKESLEYIELDKAEIKDLEERVLLTVECASDDKKEEQELFNTLLVKFESGGTLTKEDLEIYAASRGVTTSSVFKPDDVEDVDEDIGQYGEDRDIPLRA